VDAEATEMMMRMIKHNDLSMNSALVLFIFPGDNTMQMQNLQ
jgi:hypothetical protein